METERHRLDCKSDAIDHVITYARLLGVRTRSWLSLVTLLLSELQTY